MEQGMLVLGPGRLDENHRPVLTEETTEAPQLEQNRIPDPRGDPQVAQKAFDPGTAEFRSGGVAFIFAPWFRRSDSVSWQPHGDHRAPGRA